MTLSFTHIVWIIVLSLSSFAAGWLLRRLRAIEREAAFDVALREAEQRASGLDADRQQHMSLLKRNLETEAAATAALEGSLRRKSNELTQARSALQEARAEIKTLKDTAAARPPSQGDAGATEGAVSEHLTAVVAERDRKLLQLEVEVARQAATNAEQSRLAHEHERTIASLNEEVDKWRVRVPKLAESLKARDATIAERQHAIDALTAQASTLQQQHEVARSNIHELARQLDDTHRELNATRAEYAEATESSNKRLAALNTDRDTLASEIETLRNERYELVRTADAQRAEITAHERRAAELEARVAAARNEYTAQQTDLAAGANECETLRAELAAAGTERAQLGAMLAALEADRGGLALNVEALEQRLRDAAETTTSRDAELRAHHDATTTLQRELQELTVRSTPLKELLDRRDAELMERGRSIEALQAQIAKLDATLAERHNRIVELERGVAAKAAAEPDPRAEYLEKRLVQQMDKNHELTRALTEREKQIGAIAREKTLHEKSLAVLTQQLLDARLENERLAIRLTGGDAPSVPSQAAAPVAPQEDNWQRPIDAENLQAIHGIGRSFERRLNELGITRLSHIVNLAEEEIDSLERELDTFKGRIDRDDWVGQAAALIADSGELDRPLPPVPDTRQPVVAGAP